jgi:hypothetical protein
MPAKQGNLVLSDWLAFAALMLLITGLINILEGILTLVYPHRAVVVADRLYVVGVVGWGILILVVGVILVAAGVGVVTGRTWARVAAMVCVALHAVVQVATLAAYPVWSALMLVLDVLVLYALAARWNDTAPADDSWSTYDPHRDRDERMLREHPRIIA